MIIKKRLKDYPSNVPKKLFKLLKECQFNRSMLADRLQVNSGYISQLLNKGIEPPDTTKLGRYTRRKLFLKAYKQKPEKLFRTKQKQPDFMIKWRHLETEERQAVIKQYIEWRQKHGPVGNNQSH